MRFINNMTKRQQAKAIIVLIGLLLFSASLPQFPFFWIWSVIFFAALIATAEFLDVTLPQGSHISVSSAFVIAMIYIMPIQPALAATGLGLVIAALLRVRHVVWEEMFYEPAKYLVSLACAYLVYIAFKATAVINPDWGFGILNLIAATAVFYLVDTMLDQLNLSHGTWRYLLRSYLSSWRLAGTTYLALGCSGLLIAVTFTQIGYWGIVLLCLPLFVIRHSFKLYINIKKTYQNTIEALASAIETQDPCRRGHAKRVADYSIAIARELGIYGHDLEMIGYGALLHDIGKLGKDEDSSTIFNVPLNQEDQHSLIGSDIVKNIKYLPGVPSIIASHHKPFASPDEGGDDESMLLSSRIVNVASAFDNLVNMPIFDERLDPREALKVIKREQSIIYDPVVIRALAEVLRHTGELSFRF